MICWVWHKTLTSGNKQSFICFGMAGHDNTTTVPYTKTQTILSTAFTSNWIRVIDNRHIVGGISIWWIIFFGSAYTLTYNNIQILFVLPLLPSLSPSLGGALSRYRSRAPPNVQYYRNDMAFCDGYISSFKTSRISIYRQFVCAVCTRVRIVCALHSNVNPRSLCENHQNPNRQRSIKYITNKYQTLPFYGMLFPHPHRINSNFAHTVMALRWWPSPILFPHPPNRWQQNSYTIYSAH